MSSNHQGIYSQHNLSNSFSAQPHSRISSINTNQLGGTYNPQMLKPPPPPPLQLQVSSYNFVEPFSNEYFCTLCRNVFRDPVSLPCGHRFCEDCINSFTSSDNHCPISNCGIEVLKHQIVRDNFISIYIREKAVYCINKPHCSWMGQLKDHNKHLNECIYHKEVCSYCKNPVPASEVKIHVEKFCEMLPMVCNKCGINLIRKDFDRHVNNECQERLITCPFGCSELITVKTEIDHINPWKMNCKLMQRDCPYVSCPFKGIADKMDTHLKDQTWYHAGLYREDRDRMNSLINSMNRRLEALQEQHLATDQVLYTMKHYVSRYFMLNQQERGELEVEESADRFSTPRDGRIIWKIDKCIFQPSRPKKWISLPFYTSPIGTKVCCIIEVLNSINLFVKRLTGEFDRILIGDNSKKFSPDAISWHIHFTNSKLHKSATVKQHQIPNLNDNCVGPFELIQLPEIFQTPNLASADFVLDIKVTVHNLFNDYRH